MRDDRFLRGLAFRLLGAVLPGAFLLDAVLLDAFLLDAVLLDVFLLDAFLPVAFLLDVFLLDAFVLDAFLPGVVPFVDLPREELVSLFFADFGARAGVGDKGTLPVSCNGLCMSPSAGITRATQARAQSVPSWLLHGNPAG